MINIAKPMIGPEEKQAVLDVLDSGMLAQGPRVKAFEEAFAQMCGAEYAIATSSGTTALHVAVLAHGIGAGDEVVTSPFTFIASANSILYAGARPVFVDIDLDTFNMDPGLIEAAITPRTRAIMPIHLFGLSCDMNAISAIASKHGLQVIEDACQSHGASCRGRRVGSFGTGAFSFYPTKNMTCGEGGMITTHNIQVDEKCRVIRQHGMRRRYYHDELGFNFRMTDIQAAIGFEQLKKLAGFNRTRQENARYLSSGLRGVVVPTVPDGYEHVYHQYTIRVPKVRRDALRDHLREKGIGTEVYYPVPVHQQEFYVKQLGYRERFPKAEQAAAEVLSLPVHVALRREDLDAIISALNEFMETEVSFMLKAAVIGVGAMGRNHARVYSELPSANSCGRCRPEPRSGVGCRAAIPCAGVHQLSDHARHGSAGRCLSSRADGFAQSRCAGSHGSRRPCAGGKTHRRHTRGGRGADGTVPPSGSEADGRTCRAVQPCDSGTEEATSSERARPDLPDFLAARGPFPSTCPGRGCGG